MSARRVAILAGGRSSEHEVSVASARSVADSFRARGFEVVLIEIDRGGRWAVGPGPTPPPAAERGLAEAVTGLGVALAAGDAAPDGRPAAGALARAAAPTVAAALAGAEVVFPLLHGPFGEDGTVQGLLELADLPYVGAGVAASAIAMDKDLFKALLRERGVRVARHVTLRAGEEPANPFGYPVFVKPARLGSSIGISKVHHAGELAAAVALAFAHDEKVVVEEFVAGVEIEVGVLGNREPVASEPGEIVLTRNEWYDYEAKYAEGGMEPVIPARISPAARERARALAIESFRAIECEGMARVDMFVDRTGEVVVNELNTIPGFTETSVYAKLFAASGLGYGALLDRLVELALERHARRRPLAY